MCLVIDKNLFYLSTLTYIEPQKSFFITYYPNISSIVIAVMTTKFLVFSIKLLKVFFNISGSCLTSTRGTSFILTCL